jgi:hypothetical protein
MHVLVTQEDMKLTTGQYLQMCLAQADGQWHGKL